MVLKKNPAPPATKRSEKPEKTTLIKAPWDYPAMSDARTGSAPYSWNTYTQSEKAHNPRL